MTVHEMPAPASLVQADAQRTRAGRYKMLALLLVCAAPVLASYFTYYVWQPEGRRHFGDLVVPPRDMPAAKMTDLQGQVRPLQSLRGQWLLLVVSSGACDATCEGNLYFQRQLREMQGKDKDRIDRVWLLTDGVQPSQTLRQAMAQATVVRVPTEALHSWLQPAPGHDVSDHLYVIDPMGNWMLRFPANMDVQAAAKAKRDLERLMRASNAWDQAGR